MAPELIFCYGKNPAFTPIALTAGFRYGAQLPCATYAPVYFADNEYRKPNRAAYMSALEKHRPKVATVLDWMQEDELPEVLSWAEEAAQWVERLIVIPKVSGQVGHIPTRIGGRDVILGYSVPTSHGGTDLMLWEFSGRPVHLLGGSPHRQMRLARDWFHGAVVSVDGNMHCKLATKRGQFWMPGTARYARDHYWPKLSEAGWVGEGAPTEAFRRSCQNIMAAWSSF